MTNPPGENSLIEAIISLFVAWLIWFIHILPFLLGLIISILMLAIAIYRFKLAKKEYDDYIDRYDDRRNPPS